MAYANLGNTITGATLEYELESSPFIWTITNLPTNSSAYTDYDSQTISIDPDFHPWIFTNSTKCAVQQASTELILEHELAHAATWNPNEMNDVLNYENPYEAEALLPLRLTYDLPKAYLPLNNPHLP
jgi:hypothetical protein